MARYCSSCGSLLDESIAFCGNCGTKRSAPIASQSTPSGAPQPASTAPNPSPATTSALSPVGQSPSRAPSTSLPTPATDASASSYPARPMVQEAGRAPSIQAANAAAFHQAIEQYHLLLARYQRSELNPAAFEQAVAALRVTDATGAVWQIHPQNSSWLKWSGSAWIPSNPPIEPKGGLGGEVVASVKASAGSILSQLPRMILRQFLARLPVAALTGLSVWAIHSILLVWKNQGFNFQEPWGPYINSLGGAAGPGSAAVIWGVPLALIWSTIFSLFRNGPTATIKSLAAGPTQLLRIPRSGNTGLAGFIIGGGGGLFLSSMFGLNAQAGFLMSFSSVFLIAGYPGMLLSRAMNDLWTNVFKPRTPAMVGRIREVSNSALTGLSAGFLLLGLLPKSMELMGGIVMIGVGAYLLVAKNSATPSTPAAPASTFPHGAGMSLFAWIFASATTAIFFDWLFCSSVHADDGGSNEIMGGDGTDAINWTNAVAWWNSEGSGRALAQGAPPALASGLSAGLIPPMAAPVGGLIIQDDVTKGETTEEGETFNYACSAQTNGERLIPADGRTPRQFYTICDTNNPKWTKVQMTSTARFYFTAPTGFTLQAQKEFISGSGAFLHAEVICIPPAEAAYAPGRIPGVVYASANTPLGTVTGHCAVEIEVGGGEMTLHPLDRDWIRGPMSGQTPDSLTLFARLSLPAYCYQVPDAELNQTLTLKTLGDSANYLYVPPPQDVEAWRSWVIAPNDQLQPSHLENAVTVNLGLEGRIMGGLLQKEFQIKVLPYLKIKFEPSEPFLVKDCLEEIEVVAKVNGAAPGEEWSIEDPVFSSGDHDIILSGSVTPKPPAEAILKFQLGNFPDNRDAAGATFKVKARLTKATKDYNGPTETEEANLTVNVRRPGLIFLTKMPVHIPGDGKTAAKFQLTVLKYTPGEGGKPGTLTVDEAMLKDKALKFADKIEAEGEAAKAFNAAALHITYEVMAGEGLNKHATYSIQGSAVIPGSGTTLSGKLEISVPTPPPNAKPEDYTKNLELGLDTIKIPDKTDDYAKEKILMLQALDQMILRPYSTLQQSWANASKLEWEADWVRSWWGQSSQDSLDKLMQLYEKYKDELDKDTRHEAFLLHWRRRDFYQEVTKAWQAVATSSAGVDNVLAAGEYTAVTAKWLSEAVFPKLVEIALVSMSRSPKWADFGGSAAGYLQKYINFLAGAIAEAYANSDPSPWIKGGQKTVDEIWNNLITDMFDLFYGSQAEKPFEKKYDFGLIGPEGTAHALRVKSRLYVYFAIIKLFQHWIWEKKENGDDKDFTEACGEVINDLAVKTCADAFEFFIGDVPEGGASAAMSNFKGAMGDSYHTIVEFLKKCERLGEGRP